MRNSQGWERKKSGHSRLPRMERRECVPHVRLGKEDYVSGRFERAVFSEVDSSEAEDETVS